MDTKPATRLATIVGAFLMIQVGVQAEPLKDETVLKGKVQASDRVVRLQRPKLPRLDAQSPVGNPGQLKAAVNASDFNFSLKSSQNGSGITYTAETPERDDSAAPTQQDAKPLASEAEDADMVIAWEQWHKRVCQAIYENWIRNSKIPGIAHTTLTVTRDHHITVDVRDVNIAPHALEMLPRAGASFRVDQLNDEFVREIQATISVLDGTSILEFPSGSRRTTTSFHPYFSKDGDMNGYEWRRDDYERVHLR